MSMPLKILKHFYRGIESRWALQNAQRVARLNAMREKASISIFERILKAIDPAGYERFITGRKEKTLTSEEAAEFKKKVDAFVWGARGGPPGQVLKFAKSYAAKGRSPMGGEKAA